MVAFRSDVLGEVEDVVGGAADLPRTDGGRQQPQCAACASHATTGAKITVASDAEPRFVEPLTAERETRDQQRHGEADPGRGAGRQRARGR